MASRFFFTKFSEFSLLKQKKTRHGLPDIFRLYVCLNKLNELPRKVVQKIAFMISENLVSAQPAPSGFEVTCVLCSCATPNERRMAWDEGRDYWEAQLSEYWDSGLTIQEYSELKELPYESTRRWIRVLQKARQDEASTPESLELVEIKPLQTNASDSSGIRLLIDGIEITVAKGFDGTTLSEVLNLLKARSCSASAVR